MTRLTALIIQTRGDDVFPHVIKGKNGLWGWAVDLYRDGAYDRPMLTQRCKHATEQDAQDEIDNLLKEVKEMEL